MPIRFRLRLAVVPAAALFAFFVPGNDVVNQVYQTDDATRQDAAEEPAPRKVIGGECVFLACVAVDFSHVVFLVKVCAKAQTVKNAQRR